MESERRQRWQQLRAAIEPGFRQMLLLSFLLHLLVPLLYWADIFPAAEVKKPPVYRVNLVNKPVKNPQAGRPEATPAKKKKEAVKSPPKPKPKPKPVPKPEPKPEPKPLPKPEPKPEPKPAPKPEKADKKESLKPSTAEMDALQKRLQALQEKRAKQAAEQQRKDKIAALEAAVAAETKEIKSPVSNAPVGMADGQGDEEGVAAIAFVREYIQQQWSFSRYQANGSPEAEVVLHYNADGTLMRYRFVRKSNDQQFDESLRRAVLKSKQLPQPLPEPMTFEIVFNLKQMLNR